MRLRLYDTAKGEVVELAQRDPGKVSFYACGPTVYDLPHMGHGRMVLTYDILRRFIESQGIEVHHVSNITDIEDKIINRSRESGVPYTEITEKYEGEWYAAMDKLNVLRPHDAPHATAYVTQMIDLIEALIARDVAYETDDTIYFSPDSVANYGLLARQSLESLKAGARVERDEQKRSSVDFALWKKVDETDTPNWPSPWGPGRPGWHTECVVMSLDILGDGFDLHTGGLDLAFPHHENERAQAVALGKTFAKHWMHNGFIEMGGEKMSKSLGNFTTLTDMLEKHDPRAYRMLVLRSHYRSPFEVTPDTIEDAEKAVSRLDRFVSSFGDELGDGEAAPDLIEAFVAKMENDLDTPGAVALVFGWVREANADNDAGNQQAAQAKARAVVQMLRTVGLELKVAQDATGDAAALATQRDAARAAKDWARADALRQELTALGYKVEDTAEGTRISK